MRFQKRCLEYKMNLNFGIDSIMKFINKSQQTKMSSRRYQRNSFSIPSSSVYNPELVYGQMQRMQNLLEEYDRENQFLNKQVLDLLNRKQWLDSNDNNFTFKLKTQSRVKNKRLQPKQQIYDLPSSKVLRDFSSRKTYESIYIKQRSTSPYLNKPNKSDSKTDLSNFTSKTKDNRYKYYMEDDQQKKRVPKQSITIFKIETNNKSQYIPKKSNSPQKISRLIGERELQKISESQQINNGSNVTKQEIRGSVNMVPLIKRQVYIKSPQIRSSFPMSPQKNEFDSPQKIIHYQNPSRVSLKSNRSKQSNKSGIEVTLSDKSRQKIIANRADQNKNQSRVHVIAESAIKVEPIKKSAIKTESINKNQVDDSQIVKKVLFIEGEARQSIIQPNQEKQSNLVKPPQKKFVVAGQFCIHEAPLPQSKIKQVPILRQQSQYIPRQAEEKPSQRNLSRVNSQIQSFQGPAQNQVQGHVTRLYSMPLIIPPQSHGSQEIVYQQHSIRHQPSSLIEQSAHFAKNRSMSQHRIQPSSKVNYPSSMMYERSQSKADIRGASFQGKKKFINIVSSSKLSDKSQNFTHGK